jgi:hypothetical protein
MNDPERIAIMFCDALHEIQSIKRSTTGKKRLTPVEEIANELTQMLMHTGDDVLLLKLASLLRRNLLSQSKTTTKVAVTTAPY